MELRLEFSEFEQHLSDGTIPLENLHSYLELDRESAIPKLKFRDDALIDEPPDTFDIDEVMHTTLQLQDEEIYIEEGKSSKGKKKVVAEGDSWMNLPMIFNWKSIGDCLKSRKNYRVRNIGKWGHTIDQMVNRKEYMDVIENKNPEYFIFSGGGNDIQDKLKVGGIIKQYDPQLPENEYLAPDGIEAISEIEAHYRTLLGEITSTFPNVKIFTHGYDYPRPLLKGGKYLGTPLRERDIPDELMSPILNSVIETLHASIKGVTDSFSAVTHVDCLGKTKNYLWRNDFHPKNEGFNQLAILFESAMT